MGPRFESVKAHQRPVGQVVKTAASHAVNIGSNPVRVTSSERTMSEKILTRLEDKFIMFVDLGNHMTIVGAD